MAITIVMAEAKYLALAFKMADIMHPLYIAILQAYSGVMKVCMRSCCASAA